MDRSEEIAAKKKKIKAYLESKKVDCILLNKQCNFSWITAGGSDYVAVASEGGVGSVFFDGNRGIILCNNIEAPRLKDEEVLENSFEIVSYPWQEEKRKDEILKELISGKITGSDTPAGEGLLPLDKSFDELRFSLCESEVSRYRDLGRMCAEIVEESAVGVKIGETENQIAGKLSELCYSRGIMAVVNLVAADERIFKYRHPLPTDKPVKKYVMIVLCGRKWGLVAACTRLGHFGTLSEELQKKMRAVVNVDAALIVSSRPGTSLRDILRKGIEEYKRQGYPDEWRLHHQGGTAGYNPRELKATLDERTPIFENQPLAWNPSITGVKSEDTVIACKDAFEVITETPGIPTIEVEYERIKIRRSDILKK